jgi:hypothetical protein
MDSYMRHPPNGGLRVYRELDWMGDSAISLVSPHCLSFLFIFTSLSDELNQVRTATYCNLLKHLLISHVALLPLRHRESLDRQEVNQSPLTCGNAARSGGRGTSHR